MLNQVGRIIKPTGTRYTVVYHDSNSVKMYLKAIEQKYIGSYGFAHVAVGEGHIYLYSLTPADLEPLLRTGVLFVVEKGLEIATNPNDLNVARIAKTIAMLVDAE
jgi:hypothetical protein